ncbi:MAG: peptide deformylase [Candidatus Omnitrophota bacterium]
MAILNVRVFPDPVLKKKASSVRSVGPDERAFIDDLTQTMWEKDGVGLAAPQVGVLKRITVIAPTLKRGEEIVLINPEILESSGREADSEGCLSLPGIQGEVPRAKKIKFRYQDLEGQEHVREVFDFFARVVQHECDHLDGILFIDRVDLAQRQILLSQYQKA